MSYIGVGNNGQVLSVVAGHPTWAAAAAGGAGIYTTVAGSIAADFTTLSAAVAAGNSLIAVIGDTTEVSDVSVLGSGLNILMAQGANVDLGTNRFIWSTDAEIDIRGNGELTWLFTSDDIVFDVNGNNGRATIDGITLTNNSSATATLANGTDMRFSDCVLAGDVLLDGTRNQISDSDMTANLTIASGAVFTKIAASQVNGTLLDLGSGTVISDTDSY